MRNEQILSAVKEGIPIPPELLPSHSQNSPLDYIRRGLIWIAVGISLIIGGILFGYFGWGTKIVYAMVGCLTLGLIPFCIGVALLVYAKIRKKYPEEKEHYLNPYKFP